MKFTKTHEWVENEGEVAKVGVTNYAQDQLGDVVYVELPKLNRQIKVGEEVAVLESTKAAADVYSPVSGTIVEVNQNLNKDASLINSSPEKDGWIFKIKLADLKELDSMMDASEYDRLNG